MSQTRSLHFDKKPFSWLTPVSTIGIATGFSLAFVLMYGCNSLDTGLKDLQRTFFTGGLVLISLLVVYKHFWTIIPLVPWSVRLHMDSILWSQLSYTKVTKTVGWMLLGTNFLGSLRLAWSSANLVSMLLISSYETVCLRWLSQGIRFTDPLFLFTKIPSCMCFWSLFLPKLAL